MREVSGKLSKIQELAGARYVARVGIVKDYDNVWDAQQDRWHARVDSVSQNALFVVLQQTHTPFDYVYLENHRNAESLRQYDLLFYPHACILSA